MRDDTAAGQIIVAYTLYGDANLDGTVDLSDLGILGDNYGRTGTTWQEGDYNYDGKVDLSDLGAIGDNWHQSVGALLSAGPAGSLVAEPATPAPVAYTFSADFGSFANEASEPLTAVNPPTVSSASPPRTANLAARPMSRAAA